MRRRLPVLGAQGFAGYARRGWIDQEQRQARFLSGRSCDPGTDDYLRRRISVPDKYFLAIQAPAVAFPACGCFNIGQIVPAMPLGMRERLYSLARDHGRQQSRTLLRRSSHGNDAGTEHDA